MTELLGTIQTPDGTLRLDDDVPPFPGQDFVPADLESVVVDELASVLARFNRAGGDGHGSRAPDWVNLDDRMNFITNLFVSRHHRKELFDPPFDAAVLAELEGGRIPVVPTRGPSRFRANGARVRDRRRPGPIGDACRPTVQGNGHLHRLADGDLAGDGRRTRRRRSGGLFRGYRRRPRPAVPRPGLCLRSGGRRRRSTGNRDVRQKGGSLARMGRSRTGPPRATCLR